MNFYCCLGVDGDFVVGVGFEESCFGSVGGCFVEVEVVFVDWLYLIYGVVVFDVDVEFDDCFFGEMLSDWWVVW